MQIREAILKAADSIEGNPHLFDFDSIETPNESCGSPACAIGWIALHMGVPAGEWMGEEIYDSLGIERDCCFDHLTETVGSMRWKDCPYECAKALRLYADRHYPASDHIPKSVRAIFKEQVSS